jgi:hypothetical protein
MLLALLFVHGMPSGLATPSSFELTRAAVARQ